MKKLLTGLLICTLFISLGAAAAMAENTDPTIGKSSVALDTVSTNGCDRFGYGNGAISLEENIVTISPFAVFDKLQDGSFNNNVVSGDVDAGLYAWSLATMPGGKIDKLYDGLLLSVSDTSVNGAKVYTKEDGIYTLRGTITANDTNTGDTLYIPVAKAFMAGEEVPATTVSDDSRGYDMWAEILEDLTPRTSPSTADLSEDEFQAGNEALASANVAFKPVTGTYEYILVWTIDEEETDTFTELTVNVRDNVSLASASTNACDRFGYGEEAIYVSDEIILITPDVDEVALEEGAFTNNVVSGDVDGGLYAWSLATMPKGHIDKLYDGLLLTVNDNSVDGAVVFQEESGDLVELGTITVNDPDTGDTLYIPMAKAFMAGEEVPATTVSDDHRGYDMWAEILEDLTPRTSQSTADLTEEEFQAGNQALASNDVTFEPIFGTYKYVLQWTAAGNPVGSSELMIKVVPEAELEPYKNDSSSGCNVGSIAPFALLLLAPLALLRR